MNADEFFENHSIDEINKKTKISPISLRFIKNKEFEKLPRVKFIGFVRLIEKKFKVDLGELIEEYENYYNENKKDDVDTEKKEIKPKKQKSYLWVLIIILFVLSAFLYFSFIKSKTNIKTAEINNSEKNEVLENNITENNETFKNSVSEKTIQKNIENNESNVSLNTPEIKKTKEKNIAKEYNITIIPNEKVWFRAINIDNNKSVEYLTTNPKILKGNYYIKFGHGNITIMYNDQNITPNTKKILRILLKNGKFEYLKKSNRFEK
jgi:cytoskeletal protein RodZ